MPVIRQESFAGGELSPSLYGRTRSDRYRIGARTLQNYIIGPEGELQSRPGFKLCEADTLLQTCVAVGTNACAKSATGETWASKTIPAGTYRGVARGRNHWVAVESAGGARSVDGDTWSAFTIPAGVYFYDACWSDPLQLWVAVGASNIASSADASTWTIRLTGSSTSFYKCAWGNGRYVTIGNTDEVRVSTDGKNWIEGTLPAALGSATSIVFAPWLYDGAGGFLAVGFGSTDHVGITRDGFAWQTYAGLSGNWQEVAVNNDDQVFVAVANSGTYRSMKSTDGGLTWVDAGLPSSAWYSIVWQGDLWVAIGQTSLCRTSPDTTTWTSRTIGMSGFAIASAYETEQLPQKRLIPFVFSDEQALVLEFGDEYVRFIENGAYVESGGSPYELATPYGAADLPRLKYAQMGNIITITHPDYTPRELERTATVPLTFTLTTKAFDAPACPNIHPVIVRYNGATVLDDSFHEWRWAVTAICQSLDGSRTWETKPYSGNWYSYDTNEADWVSGTTYALNDIVNYAECSWYSLQNSNTGNTPADGSAWWARVGPWDVYYRTLTADDQIRVKWTAPSPTPTDYRILKWCLYRGGSDSLWGLVAVISVGSSLYFADNNHVEPDYLTRPPLGQNPFKIYDEDQVLVRTEEPSCVAHHDSRLVFGGTAERPNYLIASRVGDWDNFDQYPLVKEDDSILFGLAGRKFEGIRSLVPGRSLLVFTTASEWAVDGGQPGQPMQPTSLSARQRTERGSTWLDALKVGDDHVLFVQRKGTVIRDLAYDGRANTYRNNNISSFAKHLFDGRTIDGWCWQEDPWSVVWAHRDDGLLLSITLGEDGITGWSQHPLGGDGVVESVCSIPEGGEDAVYAIVRRGLNRTLERMSTRQISSTTEAVCLDSAVSFTFGTPTTAITGLDHLEGESVYANADGVKQGPFTVASGAITLSTAASRVHVGLQYNCDFESLDCPPGEGKTKVKALTDGWVEIEASAGGIQVGSTFDKMETWTGKEADESASVDGLMTGQAHVPGITRWTHKGRICVRQADPFPCTILAVAREVEYGHN